MTLVPNWYIAGAELSQLVHGVILGYFSTYICLSVPCNYNVISVKMTLVPNWYIGGAELPQLVHGVILDYFSIYICLSVQIEVI